MKRTITLSIVTLLIAGCSSWPFSRKTNNQNSIPNQPLVSELPAFTIGANQVPIEGALGDVDPSFVVGTVIDIEGSKGTIHSFDSVLKDDAKLNVFPLSEVVFRDFIEDSVSGSTAFLGFLSGKLNPSIKAEVTVIKVAKVTTSSASTSIDKNKLEKQKAIFDSQQEEQRRNLVFSPVIDRGIVLGYIDYIVTATLFKKSGVSGSASGYGAMVQGEWYSNAEKTQAQHILVAIWTPLAFVSAKVSDKDPASLEEATTLAIISGQILFIESKEDERIPVNAQVNPPIRTSAIKAVKIDRNFRKFPMP